MALKKCVMLDMFESQADSVIGSFKRSGTEAHKKKVGYYSGKPVYDVEYMAIGHKNAKWRKAVKGKVSSEKQARKIVRKYKNRRGLYFIYPHEYEA